MKLDHSEPYDWARAFLGAFDETIRSPLWEFPPEARMALLSERRKRFGVYDDADQPDPVYH